jgi:hypothetical protein
VKKLSRHKILFHQDRAKDALDLRIEPRLESVGADSLSLNSYAIAAS